MERERWAVSSSEGSDIESPDTPPRGRCLEPLPGPARVTKFQCPSEFTPCPQATSCELKPEKVNDPSTELWLIKAPTDFDPHSFSGRKIPLVGFQTLRSKTCKDKLYNVFSTPRGAGGVCLVLPSGTQGCPTFAGSVTIGESWEDTGSSEPRSIPTSPAPSIPPGLKLRFQPFGAASPCRLTATPPERDDTGEPKAKRRKRLKGKVAVSGDEPDHTAVAGTPRKKKSKRDQEEAGFKHSDTEMPKPKNRKQEKRRKKEREIPQTAPPKGDQSWTEFSRRDLTIVLYNLNMTSQL